MPQSGKLLAWIEPHGGDEVLAAYVGGAAPTRQPATRRCASPGEGRQWVEQEAAVLGLPVEWVAC
ncbi:MAG TPA: hypothetical protein VKI44_03600 [Acetobacteraceae bacterium]|nr:hypothetical protein [Acetobacteraceae bacterium]